MGKLLHALLALRSAAGTAKLTLQSKGQGQGQRQRQGERQGQGQRQTCAPTCAKCECQNVHGYLPSPHLQAGCRGGGCALLQGAAH